METSFISAENRSSKAKTLAIVALAVVGTFAACFVLFNQSAASTQLDDRTAAYDSFSHWKQRNNFTFGGAEDKLRFDNYLDNYEIVKAHSQKESTYTLGMTPFAAMTLAEFSATHFGFKPRAGRKHHARSASLDTTDLPSEVDWRAKGAVTPIKNQGQCGACWAFSTTGALEGLNFIKNGKLVSFSEQQLVDCAGGKYQNQGCEGGLMDDGFDYVADNGITTEDAYPYEGADGKCKKHLDIVFKNKGHEDVPVDSPAGLKAAIANGPVSVAIEADTNDFQLYTGGVLSSKGCGTTLDHGVLAVGYKTDNGSDVANNYYIVKNSWGADWGVEGFVNIAIENGDGVCGIQKDASYPTL